MIQNQIYFPSQRKLRKSPKWTRSERRVTWLITDVNMKLRRILERIKKLRVSDPERAREIIRFKMFARLRTEYILTLNGRYNSKSSMFEEFEKISRRYHDGKNKSS